MIAIFKIIIFIIIRIIIITFFCIANKAAKNYVTCSYYF